MADRPPRPRSLWPREHGAYVQLSVPLAAALVTTPSLAGLAIAAGACLAFLAGEPLRVALGERGRRWKQAEGGRARRRAVVLGVASAAAGAVGLALASPTVLGVAGAALAVGLLTVGAALRRVVHTLGGEMLAATALSGASAPVAVAGGASPRTAVIVWLAWALGYATTVIAVHHVLERNRRPASRADLPRWLVFVALVGAVAVVGRRLELAWLAAPLLAGSLVVLIRPPRAKHLRTVGVVFLVLSLVGAAYLVVLAERDGALDAGHGAAVSGERVPARVSLPAPFTLERVAS